MIKFRLYETQESMATSRALSEIHAEDFEAKVKAMKKRIRKQRWYQRIVPFTISVTVLKG